MTATILLAFRLGRDPLAPAIETYVRRARGLRDVRLREQRKPKPTRARPDVWRVLCTRAGTAWTTETWAERWQTKEMDAIRHAEFCVGAADGWPLEHDHFDDCCSFGGLRLPHGLAALVLAEQLYRILTIVEGHPYHLGHGA